MNSPLGQLLNHCRILVVEDEYFIADDMAKALESLGADVVGPASDQQKALALLSSTEKVHAAVLDINLRGCTAFPIADTLIEQGVPFVFTTGYAPASVPPIYADIPRWEKPFNYNDLAQSLPDLVRNG
ncbi:CheY-like receiver domain-containing protein [Microvirga lotononidis]|uniref:CheY-like receiver domain-containing protein n=2 Tax=Microvirga lotononidis TaxID=864069 RepID=I4YLV9_9HYPH|nr:response regulator [Microvirga lotononidis]EIM24951.1 CheY-like receiver domain-containing protein [Microvirga lotononidis]